MRWLKRIYRPIVAFLVRLAGRVARALPRRLALRAGELLGRACYHLFPGERRKAVENLTLAFGKTRPRREVLRLARACFRTLGRSVFEALRLEAMTDDEMASLVDADSFTPAERVLARGKGLIVFSAHVGTWELLAAYLASSWGDFICGQSFLVDGGRTLFR